MDRFILIIICFNLLAVTAGNAQDRITTLSLEDAAVLASGENCTLQAAQFDYQATRANEITAALIPNPSFSYLGEQLNEGSNVQQYTVAAGQIVETGGKRQGRLDSARGGDTSSGALAHQGGAAGVISGEEMFTDVLTAKLALVRPREGIQAWTRTGRWHSIGEMIRTDTERLIRSLSNAMR